MSKATQSSTSETAFTKFSGGPLGVDSSVAELFAAHLETMTGKDSSARAKAAAKRDRIAAALDAKQAGYASLVCRAIAQTLERVNANAA